MQNRMLEHRERRGEIGEELQALRDKIAADGRTFTSKEEKQWDEATDEYDRLTKKIDIEARVEQVDFDRNGENPLKERIFGGRDRGLASGFVVDPFADRSHQAERWIDKRTGREIPCFTHGDNRSCREFFRRQPGNEEIRDLTLGQCVRAWITGKPESKAEERALDGSTDAAGGFTIPNLVAGEFLDRLRENASVLKAGARIFPFSGTDNMTVARLNVAPTLSWEAQGSTLAVESAMTIAGTTFQPKTVRTTILVSRELIQDSVNAPALIAQTMVQEFAREMDRVALVGSGSGEEPLGLHGTTGPTQLDLSGSLTATDPYNEIIDMREDMLDANAPDPFQGDGTVILHQRESTTLNTVVTSGVRLVRPDIMDGTQMVISQHISLTGGTGVESTMYIASRAGWANLMIGLRMPLLTLTLRERYSEEFSFGFLGAMRMDIGFGNAAAIGRLTGIKP